MIAVRSRQKPRPGTDRKVPVEAWPIDLVAELVGEDLDAGLAHLPAVVVPKRREAGNVELGQSASRAEIAVAWPRLHSLGVEFRDPGRDDEDDLDAALIGVGHHALDILVGRGETRAQMAHAARGHGVDGLLPFLERQFLGRRPIDAEHQEWAVARPRRAREGCE